MKYFSLLLIVWVGLLGSGSSLAQQALPPSTPTPPSVFGVSSTMAAWTSSQAEPLDAAAAGAYPGYFYNCHSGSFAIYGRRGSALFKSNWPYPVAIDARLHYYTSTPGYWWYASPDRHWTFAFAYYPGCGGCGCGHCTSYGYRVWVYYDRYPVLHCCADRCRIYGLWHYRTARGVAEPSDAAGEEALPSPPR